MAKVNPSELREIAEICTSEIIREKGITKYNYIPLSKFRCKVKTDKTNFFYTSDNRKMVKSLIFICYKRSHFIEDNFVKYKNKMYRITNVIPMEDNLFCQVYAERVD